MGNNMGIIIFIISNEKHKEDLKLDMVINLYKNKVAQEKRPNMREVV